MRTRREAVDTSKCVSKSSPFLHVLRDIFICNKWIICNTSYVLHDICCLQQRLSLLLYKTFAMNCFLSLKRSTVFLSMEFFIGYSKTSLLEMGGGQVANSTYAIRGCSKRIWAYNGRRGSNFFHFGAYVLIEWPIISLWAYDFEEKLKSMNFLIKNVSIYELFMIVSTYPANP